MSKRAVEIKIDEKEPQIPVSQTKEEFKALIEAYAKRCPEKYEIKKEALAKQLAEME